MIRLPYHQAYAPVLVVWGSPGVAWCNCRKTILQLYIMTMERFKEAIGSASIVVKRNPKTDKLFAVADDGSVFRVQGDLDPKKPVEWIVKAGDLENATLVNEGRGAQAIATF